MFDLGFLIFIGFICSIIGMLMGVGLYRNNAISLKQAEQLKQQLSDAKSKNDAYQQNVADHFSQTAVMLNDLTEKYKDIHQHLALGADQLCRDEEGHSLLIDSPLSDNINRANRPVQQPLDYAPKSNAANSGTLSEEYGLEKVNINDTPAEANDPPHRDDVESTDPEDEFSDPKIHAI